MSVPHNCGSAREHRDVKPLRVVAAPSGHDEVVSEVGNADCPPWKCSATPTTAPGGVASSRDTASMRSPMRSMSTVGPESSSTTRPYSPISYDWSTSLAAITKPSSVWSRSVPWARR